MKTTGAYYEKCMVSEELEGLIKYLKKKSKYSRRGNEQLAMVRLLCCAGLRINEARLLHLDDLMVDGAKPVVMVPTRCGKRRKARRVPLWISPEAATDIARWKIFRINKEKSQNDDPVFKPTFTGKWGTPGKYVGKRSFQQRWTTIVNQHFEPERAKQLTSHAGRHTMLSHCIEAGVPLPVVRDIAGHSDIATTSRYLHSVAMSNKVVFEY